MAFKRIKDWATSITSFRTGDVIPVDGPSGTAKMSKDVLLQLTAQNALAGNVAQAFDPTRTSENSYRAGESVTYEGKTYTFNVDHYGAWASVDVYTDNVINATLHKVANGDNFYSILKNALSVQIDNSYNVVSGWKASLIKVQNGMNVIEFDNPTTNFYSYRIYFLSSDSLVVGNAAPIVYPIVYEVNAGEKKEFSIPFNCTYILVSVYQDIPVNYCFRNDPSIVPIFKLLNTAFLSDGTIGSKSDYNLFVIETKNLDSKYVKLSKITSNRFTSAYCVDNSFSVGAISLYSDSEIGVNFEPYADDAEVCVPIPTGVNFILISSYKTGSFEAAKSDTKKEPRQSVFYSKVNKDIPLECVYGDEVIFRATSTYLAGMGGIRLQVHNFAGSYTNVGWLSYGRYYVKINSPLASMFRFIFTGGDNAVYRIEAGPLVKYDDSKFTIAYLNAGCFDHGESTSPTTDPADGQEFVDTWINLLKEISPDAILFSEWYTKMTTGDSFLSKRKLLNNYPCVQENTNYGAYANKAMASRFDATAFTTVLFTNQLSANSRRNFSFSKIDVFGKKVNLVVTHLENDSTIRAMQMAELVTYFTDAECVIIGGDFNCSDISEYQPFTDAGYDMANGDMWGVVYTYIGNSVSPAANYPTDNIVVKGLKMKNPRFPYNIDATDHKAVVADVYLT